MSNETEPVLPPSGRHRWTWRRALFIVATSFLLIWLMIGFINPLVSADGDGGFDTGRVQP